ncbi:MAG TPA: metalloregulator ArsR/SmtB family transcription factor [Polyangiaceae bacterium]|nr:metalloregulator ArsR/SmtB family transcription factor [Polyangiaceae bacterium]
MHAATPGFDGRWQLYRLLSDPFRLRLLALAGVEELALGELADLLGESQPNVSRHAAPLRQAGLLAERKQGTRTLVRLPVEALSDAVVRDAVAAGRALCVEDGSLERVAAILRGRDEKTREFFAKASRDSAELGLAPELPAYLAAFGALLPRRELAVDAGTGDGVLLDLLAPVFKRVIAVDRSAAQLERASRRVKQRGYVNVELVQAELGAEELLARTGQGADVVVAARVLHHAPLPRVALAELSGLLLPGGKLLVIDYARHTDEQMAAAQADVWLGFEADELLELSREAGFQDARVVPIPQSFAVAASDGHVGWQLLAATKPEEK